MFGRVRAKVFEGLRFLEVLGLGLLLVRHYQNLLSAIMKVPKYGETRVTWQVISGCILLCLLYSAYIIAYS